MFSKLSTSKRIVAGFVAAAAFSLSLTIAPAYAAATSTAIQGKCYANYGTTTSSSTVDLFQQNTGSGTTNHLEGKIVGGGGTNPKDVATNLVVTFVRATTE